jgi:serine/threonine protein kinase
MNERQRTGFSDEWGAACERFLPVPSDDERWRYSRAPGAREPEQGWKLHLSATVLTASEALRRVAPLLLEGGMLFKAPATLEELNKINSGLDYGYSQVGKIITVYPRDDEEAVRIAHQLHDLTFGIAAPAIPFDRQYRPGSALYYRYGGFKSLEIASSDGANVPAVRTPEGRLIPDSRISWASDLPWLSDPFQGEKPLNPAPLISPLKTRYRVFRALSQRGKGGVYQALDMQDRTPRLCVIKEGRRNGETSLDGRDGFSRVQREAQVISHLQGSGVETPRVISTFEVEGSFYMAMEFIAGKSLLSMLGKRQRRLGIKQSLQYGMRITEIVKDFHAAGWAWRDCKPGNLIVTRAGRLRPVDFESACPIDRPTPLPWRTPDYAPPEAVHKASEAAPGGKSDDLYAVGAILYLLFTGRPPAAFDPTPATRWRRDLSPEVLSLLSDLLAPDPERRPDAATALERIKTLLTRPKYLTL